METVTAAEVERLKRRWQRLLVGHVLIGLFNASVAVSMLLESPPNPLLLVNCACIGLSVDGYQSARRGLRRMRAMEDAVAMLNNRDKG